MVNDSATLHRLKIVIFPLSRPFRVLFVVLGQSARKLEGQTQQKWVSRSNKKIDSQTRMLIASVGVFIV